MAGVAKARVLAAVSFNGLVITDDDERSLRDRVQDGLKCGDLTSSIILRNWNYRYPQRDGTVGIWKLTTTSDLECA